MAKISSFKSKLRYLIPLIVSMVIIALILPRKGSFAYEYTRGGIWHHETLVSAFEFPLLKSNSELKREREEILARNTPYFQYNNSTCEQILKSIEAMNFGEFEPCRRNLDKIIREVYSIGVIPSTWESETDKIIYVTRDRQTRKTRVEELYSHTTAVEEIIANIYEDLGDEIDAFFDKYKIANLITPNLYFDDATTTLMAQSAIGNISITKDLIPAGITLVKNGDIITDDIADKLDSYKTEYNKSVGYNGPVYLLWIGNFLVSCIFIALLAFFIQAFDPKTFTQKNKFYYLVLIFTLTVATIILSHRFIPDYFAMVPFVVFALYLHAFFKRDIIIPTYALSLIPILFIYEYGVQIYLSYLFAGCVAIYSFSKFNKGFEQFITALLIFVSIVFVYCSYALVWTSPISVRTIIFFLIGSLGTILFYPLVYIFERIFNLVSSSRLKDLCDLSSPLLRELSTNAAGTYHHCEQVANFAVAAAEKIDANTDLVRAGAMYHDIGKLYAPNCFVENQAAGDNSFHKDLTPMESASALIRHVTEGVEIAKDHGLPSLVIDIIKTHHGTSTTGYFYTQFINEGGSEEHKNLFTYPGPAPKTKEQVIIMLCDTLEAASRTLTDYSRESITALVNKIIDNKLNDGQFEHSEITLEELTTLREFLPKYLSDAYHGRIPYPSIRRKRNNNK